MTDLLTWQAPDTDDHAARHQRGMIRLPHNTSHARAGDLVPAWVCCDPACGGVEINDYALEREHGCCTPTRCCAEHAVTSVPARRHMAGTGHTWFTGRTHGTYTDHWIPEATP